MFRSIRSVIGLCRRHDFQLYRSTQKLTNPSSYGCLPTYTGDVCQIRFKYFNHGVQGRRSAKVTSGKEKNNQQSVNEDGEEIDDDEEEDDEDEDKNLMQDS